MSSLMKDNLPVVIAVSGGTALLATYLYQKNKDNAKYPPGPTSFPFVGNLFQLSTKRNCIPSLFNRWANRYGPIYAVSLGSVSAVVLNNMCTISDAFESKAHIFSDRPNWLPLMSLIYRERGMVWQNGETWQDMRQCVMKALGGCGMPSVMQSESIEQRIQHEVGKLVREFAKFEQECKPFCPFELLHKAVCNIICSIVFGCRFKYTSQQFERFICQIRQLAECNILDSTTFFPLLASLPLPRLKSAMSSMSAIICFIEKEMQRHRENFDPTCIRDFIDLYLKEAGGANRQQIEVAIIDLFVCGAEPTSSALSWAMLCLVAFPDIQRRCHEELDQVVSGGRLPELDDKHCLPFIMATLHEVLRRFTVLPLGIPHATQQDAALCGYAIPCETVVICNHQAVHLNETSWNNPCEFDPERFLDEDCEQPRLLRCIANFLPFGLGPRACAGKELSMDLLFLMFTGLLQRFEFQKGCDCDLTKCFEGKYNFTFTPMPFKVKLRVHC